MQIIKSNQQNEDPLVSIILLDWSVRDHYHSLDWLSRQNVARSLYELIWVELYERAAPEVLEKADVVITCRQTGLYHKHKGYNTGLIQARGVLVTVCDSDAVFPANFISSILERFFGSASCTRRPASPLVLMHHEWRTRSNYPESLSEQSELANYEWLDLWPNAGACMTIRKEDAIRFGGFDEHRTLRGYYCGPFELGWRLVNAGIPESWHPESTALWHFAHPAPVSHFGSSFWRRVKEVTYPHVDHHALTAVEAFSTGRLLPLSENGEIHKQRMSRRTIGSTFEEKYAWLTDASGFTRTDLARRRVQHLDEVLLEPTFLSISYWMLRLLVSAAKRILGRRLYLYLRDLYRASNGKPPEMDPTISQDACQTAPSVKS